jgi:hypothetical protein
MLEEGGHDRKQLGNRGVFNIREYRRVDHQIVDTQ